MRTGTGKRKNSREFEAFSRCPRTPGQTPTATELASPHTAGPQTPPITAEFLPVSFPSVLPPSVLRSSLHVSTDCTPRTGALVETLTFELYQNSGDRDLAQRHLALSRDTIMKLANSLPAEEPLRQTFLSAPAIRKILDDRETPYLRAKEA